MCWSWCLLLVTFSLVVCSVSGVCSDGVFPESLSSSVCSLGFTQTVFSQRLSHLSCFSSAGYAFLLFQEESSVQALIDACIEEDGKLYLCVSSPTIKDKPVSEASAIGTPYLEWRTTYNGHISFSFQRFFMIL